MSLRALLFVPGNRPEMIRKAPGYGPDGVILDLEDAVLPADRPAARAEISGALAAWDRKDCAVVVRISNPREADGQADLAALEPLRGRFGFVMVPKTESAEEVREAAQRLGASAIAILETARGVLEAEKIAEGRPAPAALMFGAGDLAADLGAELDETALLHARSRVVLAAAANRLEALDYPHLWVKDLEGLERAARHALSLGYTGKTCVHPAQIPVVKKVFTPPPEKVAWARKVTEAYRKAGRGAIAVDGELVDLMTIRLAEGILKRSKC